MLNKVVSIGRVVSGTLDGLKNASFGLVTQFRNFCSTNCPVLDAMQQCDTRRQQGLKLRT